MNNEILIWQMRINILEERLINFNKNNMMYGYGLGNEFGFMGGFFMLIFWILIIWLLVSLVRGGFGQNGKGGCCGLGHQDDKKIDSAMEILKERFAKSEISKEEFEEKIQVLKK